MIRSIMYTYIIKYMYAHFLHGLQTEVQKNIKKLYST